VATFYVARSEIITPLPWQTFALPFSQHLLQHILLNFRRKAVVPRCNRITKNHSNAFQKARISPLIPFQGSTE